MSDNDIDLLPHVRSMLEADSRADSILDRGLPEVADRLIRQTGAGIQLHEIGAYRLIRFLGEGGMGVVYLAERKDAGNQVAIKFLLHAGLSPARRRPAAASKWWPESWIARREGREKAFR